VISPRDLAHRVGGTCIVRLWAVIATLILLAAGGAAHAATCSDVNFADGAKVGATPLVLNGLGLRKATILAVKVYVAALYLPQKSGDPAGIVGANKPWRLDLHFVRDVGVSDIRDGWQEGFEKSAGDKLPSLRLSVDALKAMMTDMKSGQLLVFAYDPAIGVTTEVNGAAQRPVAGADFAAALLGIWLGPKPPNGDLKSGLLGGKCE
jgi:hypothetical protein